MAAGPVRAINARNGNELSGNLSIACDQWHRLKGLLGQKSLSRDEGLLIRPCRCVHTLGMKFPIDLIFLNEHNKVISAIAAVPPNRLPPTYLGAYSVIELAAGRIAETATLPGDLIIFSNASLAQASLSGPKVAAPALSQVISKHRGHSRKLKSPISLEARQLLWPGACSLCLHLLLAGAVAAVWQSEPEVVWVSVSTFLGAEQVQVGSRGSELSDLSAAAEAGEAEGPAGTEEADDQQRDSAHQLDHERSPTAGVHPNQPVPPSDTVDIVEAGSVGKSAKISSSLIALHQSTAIAKAHPPIPLAHYSPASLGARPRQLMRASEMVLVQSPTASVLVQSPTSQPLPSGDRQLQFPLNVDQGRGSSSSPLSREQKPPKVSPAILASTADDAPISDTTAATENILPKDGPSPLHQGKPAVATPRVQVLAYSPINDALVAIHKMAGITKKQTKGARVSLQKKSITSSQELTSPGHAVQSAPQQGTSPALAVQHLQVEGPVVNTALAVPTSVKPTEKESRVRTYRQPEPVFEAPVRGDLELYMTGDEIAASGTRILVLFRTYPRKRHKTPMSPGESKRLTPLSPRIQRTGIDSIQAVIEVAADGIYEFRGESDTDQQEVNFAVTIHGTGSRRIVKELGTRKVGNGSYLFKVLMPEGILWEDDASFDGTIKDSDGIIKFNSETGIAWKEYN